MNFSLLVIYISKNFNLFLPLIVSGLCNSMGVPQGTTLGPFSWNSYSNDFALYIIFACLFADDSSVIVKGKTAKDVNDKNG
jgi:hypothetical protein